MKFITNFNRVFLAALSIVMLLGTGSIRPALASGVTLDVPMYNQHTDATQCIDPVLGMWAVQLLPSQWFLNTMD